MKNIKAIITISVISAGIVFFSGYIVGRNTVNFTDTLWYNPPDTITITKKLLPERNDRHTPTDLPKRRDNEYIITKKTELPVTSGYGLSEGDSSIVSANIEFDNYSAEIRVNKLKNTVDFQYAKLYSITKWRDLKKKWVEFGISANYYSSNTFSLGIIFGSPKLLDGLYLNMGIKQGVKSLENYLGLSYVF